MKRLVHAAFFVGALGFLLPAAATGQTRAPLPESEVDDATFPALPLEPEILRFPDPDFARVALKIELGTATLQERRWWYRAAERLSPFQNAPPADWRTKAAAAARALDPPGTASDGSSSSPIYRWASVGPAGNYDVTAIDGPPGAADQGRATAIWTPMNGARRSTRTSSSSGSPTEASGRP